MSWAYRSDERALKELRKLGKPTQREIIAYLDERTAGAGDPRRFGKGLKADLAVLGSATGSATIASTPIRSADTPVRIAHAPPKPGAQARWRALAESACPWTAKAQAQEPAAPPATIQQIVTRRSIRDSAKNKRAIQRDCHP
jgi:hypothetical protein